MFILTMQMIMSNIQLFSNDKTAYIFFKNTFMKRLYKRLLIILLLFAIAITIGVTIYNDWYIRFFRKPQLIQEVDDSQKIIDSLQYENKRLLAQYDELAEKVDSLETEKEKVRIEKTAIYKYIENENNKIDTTSTSQLVLDIKSYIRNYDSSN